MQKRIVFLVIAVFFCSETTGNDIKVCNFTCLDYSLVFWNFHIHTAFSNRKGTDLDHRFAPNLDDIYNFCHNPGYGLVGSDHGGLLSRMQWLKLKAKSDELSSISRMFVRGFEWSNGNVFDPFPIDFAHIIVANTTRFADSKKITPNCGADIVKSYILMWTWLNDNLGTEGQWGFPHPWVGAYQFSDFMLSPYELVNQRCCWIEIAGGPQNRKARDGLVYYIRALQKGWRVSPVYGSDNFAGFGQSEINNFTGIMFVDYVGYTPGMTLNQIALKEVQRHRVYVCEGRRRYGVYFLNYITLRDGSKVVMGDTVAPRALNQVRNFVVDTTMKINQIKEIQYHFVYPDNAKKIVVDNKKGNFDDSEVVQAFHERIPLAFFVCIVDKGGNYVVGSPIWFD